MDDDLDAAAGLASLAFADPVSGKGHGARKAPAAAKKKKAPLTEEQRTARRAVDSAKRKPRRHEQEARTKAAAASALLMAADRESAAAHQTDLVREAPRQALVLLGLNPGQHSTNATAVAAASTGSSRLPYPVPDSPRLSTAPVRARPCYPGQSQASRLSNSSGSGSPEVSVVAPATPAPINIDLNTTPVGGGSSSGGSRKRQRELPADAMPHARNLFEAMPTAEDERTHFSPARTLPGMAWPLA